MPKELGNSSEEQALLRPIALWAATYAEEALRIFEIEHPDDQRPRQALEAAQDFGAGKKRDKNLRMAAFAAMKSSKNSNGAAKNATQAAIMTAAVAYTHTDLQTGVQGIRQARHILGPIIYAAIAVETATGNPELGDELIQRAAKSAPHEARFIVRHMPPQPRKENRLDALFSALDAALRAD